MKGNTVIVELLDLQGRTLQKAEVGVGIQNGVSALSLDLNGLQTGIYLVRLQSGRNYELRKLVISEQGTVPH